MYGRFGMHAEPIKSAIIPNSSFDMYASYFNILSNLELNQYNLISYSYFEKKELGNAEIRKILREFQKALEQRTNVAIASAVTSYSRMIINQFKLLALSLEAEIYYSDTDSLVLNKELPKEYIDSATLGKLKLEHTIKEGIFALPKVYYLESKDGTIVTKAKGYPGKLSKEQYLELIQEKDITNLSITKWFRSMKESTVQIKRNQPYEIRYLFNKRRRTGFNSTTPLTIKGESPKKAPSILDT